MAFTPEVQTRIIAAIQEKWGSQAPRCAFCGQNRWTLADGFIFLSFDPDTTRLTFNATSLLQSTGLPSVALTCSHCGNTLIMNLLVLGLGDLWASRRATQYCVPPGMPPLTPMADADALPPVAGPSIRKAIRKAPPVRRPMN